MKAKFKIFSVFHKEFNVPKVDYVIPVHAGKKNATVTLNMMGDDTGENISELNPFFCELTVLYVIWKNKLYSDTDYWGLAHYRRYLTLQVHWTKIKKKQTFHFTGNDKNFKKVFTEKLVTNINDWLQPTNIVLPMHANIVDDDNNIVTMQQHYCLKHDVKGWNAMQKAIQKLYPEYIPAFNKNATATQLIPCNIMIAHKDVWNNYLEWLFNIMFEIYNTYEIPKDSYNSRALGFMSERLFNIYLYYNQDKFNIKYLPIAMFS